MAKEENQRGAGRRGQPEDAGQPAGHHYLLVIGIDAYQHCPRLYNAVKDARDVMEVLTAQYQFDDAHIITLFNEEATQANILHQLEQLSRQVTERDNLLVYFSGHGEYNKTIDEGFWIPVDGRLDNHGSFVAFSIFSRYLKAIRSFHTFVIADSCYAGSMFTDRDVRTRTMALERRERIPSRWLFTAGRNEVVSDGKPGDNSPFADSILWHLKNYDQGLLSVRDLIQRVVDDVSANVTQIPRGEPIHGVGHRGGEFILRKKGFELTEEEMEQREPLEPAPTRGGDDRADVPTSSGSVEAVIQTVASDPEYFESIDAVRASLKGHLMANELDRVFKLFDRVLADASSIRNDLILQQAQYNGMVRDQNRGLIGYERVQQTTARIRNALIYYVDQLDKEDVRTEVLRPAANADEEHATPARLSDEERRGLEKQQRLLTRKIDFFQQEMIKLSDPTQKFNLHEQIEEARERLEAVRDQLGQ